MKIFPQVLPWALALALVGGTVRAESLVVATYNLENYVPADRLVEGIFRQGYPKPEASKAALRTVIRAVDADLLAVQEMGPQPYLEELVRDLRGEGQDYPHARLLVAADADRHVAVLSRRPFVEVREHADLVFPYLGGVERVKRGLLEVVVETPAGPMTIFVLHLKSRHADRADDPLSALRRAGEAEAIRDRVLQRCPQPARARFILLGDFNDSPRSKPLRLLSRRGKLSIAQPLPARDGRGESWTHVWRKEEVYSRVDYILVSPALAPQVADGAANICDLPETRLASDHRPVWARFEWSAP